MAEKVVVAHIPTVRISDILQRAMPAQGSSGRVALAAAIPRLRPGVIDLVQHLLVSIRHALIDDGLAGIAEVIC